MIKNTFLLVAAIAAGLALAVLSQPQADRTPQARSVAPITSDTAAAPTSAHPAVTTAAAAPAAPTVAQAVLPALVAPVQSAPETAPVQPPIPVHERLGALLQAGDSPALAGFGQEAVAPEDAALLAELEAALLAEFEGS